jgi:hypothetical protein
MHIIISKYTYSFFMICIEFHVARTSQKADQSCSNGPIFHPMDRSMNVEHCWNDSWEAKTKVP